MGEGRQDLGAWNLMRTSLNALFARGGRPVKSRLRPFGRVAERNGVCGMAEAMPSRRERGQVRAHTAVLILLARVASNTSGRRCR